MWTFEKPKINVFIIREVCNSKKGGHTNSKKRDQWKRTPKNKTL
jgi:hypothetical protein